MSHKFEQLEVWQLALEYSDLMYGPAFLVWRFVPSLRQWPAST